MSAVIIERRKAIVVALERAKTGIRAAHSGCAPRDWFERCAAFDPLAGIAQAAPGTVS